MKVHTLNLKQDIVNEAFIRGRVNNDLFSYLNKIRAVKL
jgi:hypothetical protein